MSEFEAESPAEERCRVIVERTDAEIAWLTRERDEARAISAAAAERVRNETRIATELRHELDALRAKLAETEQALRADLDKHQETERMRLCAISVAAGCNTLQSAAEQRIAAGNQYWTLAYGDVCAAVDREMALRAELAALKAKPRFRTRKMTAADVRALDDEWAKSKYVGRNSWVLAMRALGFRRRVDGVK